MPLTDPELDLLAEILEDDPTAHVYLQVGEEWVRRGEWARAIRVLEPGLAEDADAREGWGWLARARLEVGAYAEAVEAEIAELERWLRVRIDQEIGPHVTRALLGE